MTPDEAFDASRDKLASVLSANARAQGLNLSVGQIYALIDTAFEQTGFRVLCAVVQAADTAAVAYAGTYETVPEDVEDADSAWSAARHYLTDYPNLAELVSS